MDKILHEIKSLVTVDVFVLVLKADRISQAHWEMIAIYRELLGEHCWSNVICVITGVDFISDEMESESEYKALLEKEREEFESLFS